ncbi:MAG TPA: hypothetical protein VIT62_06525 [Lysobacter sp.]
MAVRTTRTLNPLPFQDLEPHRFEDLVRQLAYDFRNWQSIEPTGRSGSDQGLDIRATEQVLSEGGPVDGELGEETTPRRILAERLWIFQCKREKQFGPSQVRKAVRETLASLSEPPHGLVLAVACDISKAARDVFRNEMAARGVSEFAVWAKGELEDMLFQEKNDRLLFAYFGLSLAVRRRSRTSELRSHVALKRQLTNLIGEEGRQDCLILLRDPSDTRYPEIPEAGATQARWLVCRAMNLRAPAALTVLYKEHLAALTPDHENWDAILDHDVAAEYCDRILRSKHAWSVDETNSRDEAPRDFWLEYIAEQDRAFLKCYRRVPLDRILAIDPFGDGHFPIPHVFIEFHEVTGPFEPGKYAALNHTSGGSLVEWAPTEQRRVQLFPSDLVGAMDVPPAGYDWTAGSTIPIAESTVTRLASVFAGIAGKKQGQEWDDSNDRVNSAKAMMRPFQEWRQEIAVPILSAIVAELRAAGHSARIVARSVEAAVGSHREAEESVEFRVGLHLGTKHNPQYRPSGHLRISISEYRGLRLDLSPDRPNSRGGHAAGNSQPQLESMTADYLEAEALGVIERLATHGG